MRCEVYENRYVSTFMQKSKLWIFAFRMGNPQTSEIPNMWNRYFIYFKGYN
jgi:hypothetical protein